MSDDNAAFMDWLSFGDWPHLHEPAQAEQDIDPNQDVGGGLQYIENILPTWGQATDEAFSADLPVAMDWESKLVS